jgi:hypothetical protein
MGPGIIAPAQYASLGNLRREKVSEPVDAFGRPGRLAIAVESMDGHNAGAISEMIALAAAHGLYRGIRAFCKDFDSIRWSGSSREVGAIRYASTGTRWRSRLSRVSLV